eukprot:1146135-Pelagomonas_calceolata.AAC.20
MESRGSATNSVPSPPFPALQDRALPSKLIDMQRCHSPARCLTKCKGAGWRVHHPPAAVPGHLALCGATTAVMGKGV